MLGWVASTGIDTENYLLLVGVWHIAPSPTNNSLSICAFYANASKDIYLK